MRKLAWLFTLVASIAVQAQELKPGPTPQTEGGRPLMQVLRDRHTTREFSSKQLSPQALSNLLWTAFGINRPDGRRTAASAMNWQEIAVYVAGADGLFVYNASGNRLDPVLAKDVRAATGTLDFVATAPINLVYVVDLGRTGRSDGQTDLFTAADAGFIVENVYLFCASEGLATVVGGSIDRDARAKAMKLGSNQRIVLAQSVGYPK